MSPPPIHAPDVVSELIANALTCRASDLHLEPVESGYEARYRVDGILNVVAHFSAADGRSVVLRLMVLAKLLTYRPDVPQEGRIPSPTTAAASDLRVSIMPTARGPRAAVRLPGDLTAPKTVSDLGLPPETLNGLYGFASASTGMLIVTGPAGSGKTTLLYALLSHLIAISPGTSVVTLEDPVERLIPGITQIEVTPFGELTYERALRSMLRQDPQVLMLGEVRDAATARLAAHAATSGHRMLLTLHAADPATALRRLLDMGLEPHQLTSTVYGIVAVRLLRRTTPSGTYAGRIPVAEWVRMDKSVRDALLSSADASALRNSYQSQPGHVTLRQAAATLVDSNTTNLAEVTRVLGDPSDV